MCSPQVLMHNKRMHAPVTLMLYGCPSEPAELRRNTLAKESSLRTNHAINRFPRLAHQQGLSRFQAWVGRKIGILGFTSDKPRRPLGRCRVNLVTIGVRVNP